MTWVHRLWRRRSMEEQLEKELRFHLDEHTADLIEQGLDPVEARRQARLALGGPEQVKEACRDARGTQWLEDVARDVRFAARRLRRNPGFATVSVLTLALGIGASTAIFSAVNPILFESLPYPHADRLMTIWDHGADGSQLDLTFGTYRELAERGHSFDTLAVMKSWQPTLTGPAEPARLEGQSVSEGYFRMLGVPPALGRDFDGSDDKRNGPRVVILGNGLWKRRFGADPAIVGKQVSLDGDAYAVVGVMPAGFENVLAPSTEIWSPLQYDMTDDRAWGHHLRVAGRLLPDVGETQAATEVDQIARNPLAEFPRPPWASVRDGFIVSTLQDDVTRGVKPALLAVLGAVILVLLIACVNVTNLLLARGAQRSGELAVRAALGAARTRLIRQLLAESMLVAAIGGTLGMVVAQFGIEALVALSPTGLPRAIALDGAVFAFGLGLTSIVGLAVGLIPALHASRRDPQIGLLQSSRRTAGGHEWTRNTLVVIEVALALVLLVGSGLLLRSLQQLFAIAPGFEASQMLTMQVQTSGHEFADAGTTNRFFAEALDAVRRVPGVTEAAFTSQLPLSGDEEEYGVQFESGDNDSSKADQGAFRYAVSPGYVETMGIPLRTGRLLDAHDVAGAPAVALINESFAARKFGAHDSIGQRIHVGPSDGPWYTIVGIVGDVKQTSLATSQSDAVYMTAEQWAFADNAMWLVVRAHSDASLLTPAIRNAVWSVNKDQPIVRVARMEDLVAATAGERRFALVLFEAFGITALMLAAIGIYGVLSGSVTERTREIGVRSALGASRGSIFALVVRQGLSLTMLGLAIGLGGALMASRAVDTLLFGVSRLDPITYVGVIALLVVVSVVACWVPAWRAARVDPSITLRAE